MQMEIKHRLALRHIDGRYLSWAIRSYPLTSRLTEARRFYSVEEVSFFLLNSPHAPDKPGDFEIVTIKITYELEELEELQ
jgi:hypothetical protein